MVSSSGSPGPAAIKTMDPSAAFFLGGVGATSTPSITAGLAALFVAGVFSVVTSTAFFVDVAVDLPSVIFSVGLMRFPHGSVAPAHAVQNQIFDHGMQGFVVRRPNQLFALRPVQGH